ncbi:hypothetical protein CW700_05565 [Candidatus Bathyarchaeota archaeon]|nr:MAG: hypothetical protein CW700_05565 [Candidatus Bathyarchaeota archaeon]
MGWALSGGFEGVRVYFSPCGIGFGHVGRCHPIAEELLRRGATILFSTYREGAEYVKKVGLPLVESPSIGFSVNGMGEVDLKRTSIQTPVAIPRFLRQVNAEIENMRAFRPDIVVSDSRLSSILAARLLDVPTVLILNQFQPIIPRRRRFFNLSKIADGGVLTLIGEGWGLSDRILIPDFPPPHTISLGNLRIPRHIARLVRFIGTILPVKPSEVNGWKRVRRELGVGEDEYLLFAPISGPREERLPLIAILMRLFEEFPEKYRIVMSLGEVNGGSTPMRKGNLTIIPWIPERFDYLKACDIVVSRAGHGTIMQSISFGKPQILIPTPGHTEQYSNARRARELGVAEVIEQEELTLDVLLQTVEEILTAKTYAMNLRRLGEKGRLDGVENALREIAKLVRETFGTSPVTLRP